MKVAIDSLVKFHSLGMSIKLNNPKFLSTMQKYMRPVELDKETARVYFDGILKILNNNDVTAWFRDHFTSKDINEIHFHPMDVEDPWSTVIHGDLWCNNLLFRKDEAGNVVNAKMIDFQMSYMASPLLDIVFLLGTCMDTLMSIKRFEDMLEFYRVRMVEVLKKLGCDTVLFEKESFEKGLSFIAIKELLHIILMTKVVYGEEGENIFTCLGNELCFPRMMWILKIYAEKKWIGS